MSIEKAIILIILVGWIIGGFYLMKNYKRFFGPSLDDPSESPGARSLGQTQIWSVWIGMIIAGIAFLMM